MIYFIWSCVHFSRSTETIQKKYKVQIYDERAIESVFLFGKDFTQIKIVQLLATNTDITMINDLMIQDTNHNQYNSLIRFR